MKRAPILNIKQLGFAVMQGKAVGDVNNKCL